MGFLQGLGRLLAGKPVFEAPPQPVAPGQTVPQTVDQKAAPSQLKTIPMVRIGRVECQASGNNLNVFAEVHNDSHDPIFLDRIMLAGKTRELDTQLRAGESRQFHIYAGPLLTTPPSGYAEVQYRKQSDGDYFADYHEIRTRAEGDKGYFITELLQRGPVRDI